MQRTSNTLLKKEFRLLAGGSNFGKLFILTGILGFAILSLGINDGLMEHLTEKMESPFMRLVEVQNSIGQANLDSIPLAPKFQENRIPRLNYWQSVAFAALPGGDRKLADLFYVQDTHYDSILTLIEAKDDNFITGKDDFRLRASHPGAIIVSESFAMEIGFIQNPGIGYLQLNQLNTEKSDDRPGIHFPVAAVVKKLPQNADIIITEATWSILNSRLDEPGYKNRSSRDCFLLLPRDTAQAAEDYFIINIELAPTVQESYIITVPPILEDIEWPKVEFLPKDMTIYGDGLKKSLLSPSGVFIFFPSQDLITLPGEFAQAVEAGCKIQTPDRDPIQLNLTDIESKRNLGIISGLTRILTLAITILALGFVISFVVNLLIQHIAHNGPNIGTLQAFGISNNYIILLYTKIGLMLISIAFLAGLLLSLIIGPWAMDLILAQIGLGSESEHISFTLGNLPLIGAAFIALPISVVYLTLRKKLSNSKPGDLIYSRNNSTQQ